MFTRKPYTHSLFFNRNLNKKTTNNRYSDYVMVPGCPRFPTLHPGVDDTIDYNKEMSIDHKALIQMGEATIDTLLNADKKTCPKVLFLSTGEDNTIYEPHLLSSYIKKICDEKQYPFVLHIAGHGDPEKIGSIDPDSRIEIDLFADMLVQLFQGINPDKPIHVIFHTCNSAYADLNATMPKEMIKNIIQNDTLIGKFSKAMKENGFNNITVTGYRGYYSHLESHTGSVVTDDLSNSTKCTAEHTAVTICPKEGVILPKNDKHLFFEVNIAGKNYYNKLR